MQFTVRSVNRSSFLTSKVSRRGMASTAFRTARSSRSSVPLVCTANWAKLAPSAAIGPSS